MNNGITKENLLFTRPVALRRDESTEALAEITAEVLEARLAEIDRLRIISNIDNLEEALLDILARDFKVDWWDANYSLEEKRRTLKSSWQVHKMLGTKAAVETALRAIYPKAEVQEWFQYGGEPYHFKLDINLTDEISDAARPWRVVERVNFYKSLRSHMDKIVFTFVFPPAALHIGGGVGAQAQIGVPPEPDTYDFNTALPVGGAFAGNMSLPVPEDITQPSATTILRSGGVFTFISNLSGED